jgi:type IV pilus assembly protein PilC
MPYQYLAYNAEGEMTQGVLDVESEETAEKMLWERDLTIADLKRVRKSLSLINLFPTFLAPKTRDVILFSRQFATLIDSGVPITSGLQLLAGHVSNKAFRTALNEIEGDIRMGTSLSEAMNKHPHIFPRLYCRMIEVGERSGNFGDVLRQLVLYMEKAQATASKIKGAMAYPAFVLVLAAFVVLIIVNVALPPMMGLFEEFNAELPLITRILLAVAGFLNDYKLIIFATIGLIGLAITWYGSRPSGRRKRDWLLLRLPILGQINIKGVVAKISRTMSTLLQAGLPLPEVMELTNQTVENIIIHEAIEQVRVETLLGRGISEPLSHVPFFPEMLPFMVRVGEETGTLDAHLATLADFYEEEVDRSIKAMTSMLEPAMTVVIGLIVGFVAVSVIMPMYGLLGAIR